MSKYGLTLADIEEKKSKKFMSGLNNYLGAHLLNHVEEPMDKLVNMALRHEGRLQNSKPSVIFKEEAKPQGGDKRKFQGKGNFPNKKKNEVKKSKNDKNGPKKDWKRCFKYAETGHYANKCMYT